MWGIKTADPYGYIPPYSFPPATLFHFSENGSNFTTVAPITLGGSQVDADGLAIDRTGTLYAFVRSGSDSQLVILNNTNAVATPIGPILTNYSIRGAVFTLTGHLLVLDSATNLIEINPATGQIVGSPVKLTGPTFWNNINDIAQSPSGDLIVVMDHLFYKLDPVSGVLSLLYTDNANNPEGNPVGIVGLTFSIAAPNPNMIFALNVNDKDDIYFYDYGNGFNRTNLFLNIIPSYNAGRGDLAAQIQPPIPTNIVSTFDTEADGWTAELQGIPPTNSGTASVTYYSNGGNPGGVSARTTPMIITNRI